MKDLLKKIKLNEGNISLGLGVFVMILAGVMLFKYFQNANLTGDRVEEISSASTDVPAVVSTTPQVSENKNENKKAEVKTEEKKVVAVKIDPGTEYTIVRGDNLWKIAEKTYGNGFNWVKIYEANKSVLGSNPREITIGAKIVLPKTEEIAQANTTETTKAIVSEHKVNKGDNLWTIVSNACGTGFGYPAVAAENKIENPRLIYAGQVIKITCPARK